MRTYACDYGLFGKYTSIHNFRTTVAKLYSKKRVIVDFTFRLFTLSYAVSAIIPQKPACYMGLCFIFSYLLLKFCRMDDLVWYVTAFGMPLSCSIFFCRHQKYIGKVKQAVFPTQKSGRKRVVVSTEENVIASLDLRTGDICKLYSKYYSLLRVFKQLRTDNFLEWHDQWFLMLYAIGFSLLLFF